MIDIFIAGKARPAGALAAGKRSDGTTFLRHKRGSKMLRWRSEIGARAREAVTGPPSEHPIRLRLVFYIARPKSHYGTGRNATRLRDDAPAYPTSRSVADIDKLERTALDGLTGIVYRDDSQVIDLSARKLYADACKPGLHLQADEITDGLDVLFTHEEAA